MTWFYDGKEITEVPEGVVGFVYLITSLIDGKRYIGKKKTTFKKTAIKTVKLKSGLKKKKKIRSEIPSDWFEYYGSSEALNADIVIHGKDQFRREIIHWCYNLTQLGYLEAKEQFVSDCLLKPDEYYNSWIMIRARRSNLIKAIK